MPKLEEVIQLKEDEEVRALSRRHGITIVPILFLALVLIVAPFFFLFPLFASGPAGVVVFLAVVLTGAIIAVRTFVMWDGDILIVTNRRIVDVDQQGIFARTVNEIAYENIQDFSWSKHSLMDQMLNIGHFRARSASGSLTIEAQFVPQPHELQNLVNDLRQEFIEKLASHSSVARAATPSVPEQKVASSAERESLLRQVSRHAEELDDEELEKLARKLKTEDRDIAIKHLFGENTETAKELDDEEDSDTPSSAL